MRCTTDPELEALHDLDCLAIDGNCCSAVVLRRCLVFKQACLADAANYDPIQATGAPGYATRFRWNGVPDDILFRHDASNALLDGTTATGFMVFDPNQKSESAGFGWEEGHQYGCHGE